MTIRLAKTKRGRNAYVMSISITPELRDRIEREASDVNLSAIFRTLITAYLDDKSGTKKLVNRRLALIDKIIACVKELE